MKKLLITTLLATGALAVQAKDIVDTAVAAGQFKTLATALQAAGNSCQSKVTLTQAI